MGLLLLSLREFDLVVIRQNPLNPFVVRTGRQLGLINLGRRGQRNKGRSFVVSLPAA